MQIGMIGLGRMGDSMVRRLLLAGHTCVVHDRHLVAVEHLRQAGAEGSASLQEMVALLTPPRVVWLMVPVAAVDGLLAELYQREQANG